MIHLCSINLVIRRSSSARAVEYFPAICPHILIREAQPEDYWEVAETHCSSFFPDHGFPMDLVLRADRLVAMFAGFSIPSGRKRKCLVAIQGRSIETNHFLESQTCENAKFEAELSLNSGRVSGILTIDTIAEFLPRRAPLGQRSMRSTEKNGGQLVQYEQQLEGLWAINPVQESSELSEQSTYLENYCKNHLLINQLEKHFCKMEASIPNEMQQKEVVASILTILVPHMAEDFLHDCLVSLLSIIFFGQAIMRLTCLHHFRDFLLMSLSLQFSLTVGKTAIIARTGIAYISNVAVRQRRRRKGVARSLVLEAEAVARGWGCRSIALHCDVNNLAAVALYQSQGFRCVKVPEGAKWPHPKAVPELKGWHTSFDMCTIAAAACELMLTGRSFPAASAVQKLEGIAGSSMSYICPMKLQPYCHILYPHQLECTELMYSKTSSTAYCSPLSGEWNLGETKMIISLGNFRSGHLYPVKFFQPFGSLPLSPCHTWDQIRHVDPDPPTNPSS
eukprot:Gb_18253 [translate_table: standard]